MGDGAYKMIKDICDALLSAAIFIAMMLAFIFVFFLGYSILYAWIHA
jgi:hypothetical protein